MCSISELWHKIHKLEKKIEKYNGIINILKEKRNEIKKERGIIIDDAYTPEKTYDMTRKAKWRGKREEKAYEHQKNIRGKTKNGISATGSLLIDIETAIQNLKAKIKECNDKIKHYKHEIEKLENQQQENNSDQ